MDLEKEYENRNVECKKPVLARSTKVLHNELLNSDFDVVALQETGLGSGIQKSDNFAIFNSGLENNKKKKT